MHLTINKKFEYFALNLDGTSILSEHEPCFNDNYDIWEFNIGKETVFLPAGFFAEGLVGPQLWQRDASGEWSIVTPSDWRTEIC